MSDILGSIVAEINNNIQYVRADNVSDDYANILLGHYGLMNISLSPSQIRCSSRIGYDKIVLPYDDPLIYSKIIDFVKNDAHKLLVTHDTIEILWSIVCGTSYDVIAIAELFDIPFRDHIEPNIFFKYNATKCIKCGKWHKIDCCRN